MHVTIYLRLTNDPSETVCREYEAQDMYVQALMKDFRNFHASGHPTMHEFRYYVDEGKSERVALFRLDSILLIE